MTTDKLTNKDLIRTGPLEMFYVTAFDGLGFEFTFITDDKSKVPELAIELAEPNTWRENLKFGPIRKGHEMSEFFKEYKAIGEITGENHDEGDPGIAITVKKVGFGEILSFSD